MSAPYIGEVKPVPYGFVPSGWAPCKGQLMPISQYTALFSLLGTIYGGDGKSTFALPSLPVLDAESGTLHYCIAIEGQYPQRPMAAEAQSYQTNEEAGG